MKKSLLLLTLLIVCSNSFAQTTNTFPPDGNTGVGTTDPQAKLHVNKSDAFTDNELLRLSSGVTWGGNLGHISMYLGTTEAARIGWLMQNGDVLDGHLQFFTKTGNGSLSEKMRITTDGNIGIGTSSPSFRLDIQADGNNFTQSYGTNEGGYFARGRNGYLSMNTYDTSARFGFEGSGYNAATTQLVLLNNGNIGVGTASPSEKLSVNGKIRSQSIKVTTSSWADYVFAPAYQLPSLKEVEKHIRANGRLSEIPSEEEVKKDGVDLGEMNVKLLKKVEELTLYLIELSKKMEDQEKKLNKQHELITHLQHQ